MPCHLRNPLWIIVFNFQPRRPSARDGRATRQSPARETASKRLIQRHTVSRCLPVRRADAGVGRRSTASRSHRGAAPRPPCRPPAARYNARALRDRVYDTPHRCDRNAGGRSMQRRAASAAAASSPCRTSTMRRSHRAPVTALASCDGACDAPALAAHAEAIHRSPGSRRINSSLISSPWCCRGCGAAHGEPSGARTAAGRPPAAACDPRRHRC
jgi:hypothetical protein